MTGLHKNLSPHLLEFYGCTTEFWIHLRDLGNKMVAAGASKDCTPLRAYQHQRQAAVVRRKIEWRLTLPEWWAIWEQSGRWQDRGVGRGYMMCRMGDKGAYAVGNVYIGSGVENLSAAGKKCDLPIGVAYRPGVKPHLKQYRAYCNVGGKQRHLGVFATVEEARAAYLSALAFDKALMRAAA